MQENEKNQLLIIAYFNPDRGWFISLISKLELQQREKYSSSPLTLIHNSIAIKRRLIYEMVNNVNQEMKKINDVLIENEAEVAQAIKSKKAYGVQKKYQFYLYSTIGQVEAIIVEMLAVADLIIRYVQEFSKIILDEKKKRKEIRLDMEKNGIELKWLSELKNIRHDFVHNYSSWIRFKKVGRSYKFMIVLPDKLKKEYKKQYKKYHDSVLDGETIGDFFKKLNILFSESLNYLAKRI